MLKEVLKEIMYEELGYSNLSSNQLNTMTSNKLFDVCYDIEKSVNVEFDFKNPYYIKYKITGSKFGVNANFDVNFENSKFKISGNVSLKDRPWGNQTPLKFNFEKEYTGITPINVQNPNKDSLVFLKLIGDEEYYFIGYWDPVKRKFGADFRKMYFNFLKNKGIKVTLKDFKYKSFEHAYFTSQDIVEATKDFYENKYFNIVKYQNENDFIKFGRDLIHTAIYNTYKKF